MELSEVAPSAVSFNSQNQYASINDSQSQSDSLVIQATLNSQDNSSVVSVGFDDLYKSLSVTGKNIIDKLNEALKQKLPNGIQSLKPEDVTPEATADQIVKGSTAFFDAYAKQNPDLEGEDLINSFMAEVRKGVEKGYGQAFDTLKGLGAFDYDGVQAGVEKTKDLIEEKLKAFEAQKRKDLGLDPADSVSGQTAQVTKSSLLSQAGGNLLAVA